MVAGTRHICINLLHAVGPEQRKQMRSSLSMHATAARVYITAKCTDPMFFLDKFYGEALEKTNKSHPFG